MLMGVGSTCQAAKNMRRKYLGIKIDEHCFNMAQQRLA